MRFLEVLNTAENNRSKVIGYATGVFDVLHHGHLNYLKACSGKCDLLVVGVDSDRRVASAKGKTRPYEGQQVRLEKLQKSGFVAFVKFVSSERYLRFLKPDVIFYSASQPTKHYLLSHRYPTARSIRIPDTPGISSTQIINDICAGSDICD